MLQIILTIFIYLIMVIPWGLMYIMSPPEHIPLPTRY